MLFFKGYIVVQQKRLANKKSKNWMNKFEIVLAFL